jgi:hypothetical protein
VDIIIYHSTVHAPKIPYIKDSIFDVSTPAILLELGSLYTLAEFSPLDAPFPKWTSRKKG